MPVLEILQLSLFRFVFLCIVVAIHWLSSFQRNNRMPNAVRLSVEIKWRHVQKVGYPNHVIVAASLSTGRESLVFTGKCGDRIGYIAAAHAMMNHNQVGLRLWAAGADIQSPEERLLLSHTQMVSNWESVTVSWRQSVFQSDLAGGVCVCFFFAGSSFSCLHSTDSLFVHYYIYAHHIPILKPFVESTHFIIMNSSEHFLLKQYVKSRQKSCAKDVHTFAYYSLYGVNEV